ncbi:MAG: metal-sensitive transcriptional regulator [Pseudoclavibacter sp.]|nr:metal-sensitive transcriptional regulator [Pseudoclavibacter sp.]
MASREQPDQAERLRRERERRRVLGRLRRARGQLEAVIDAVESEAPCREVLTQLAAVSSALDRAGFVIVSHAMRDCVAGPEAERGDGPDEAELERLFLALA